MSEGPDEGWIPALRSLNRARAAGPSDPERCAALLRGLERLLAVHPPRHRHPRREGSGAHGYRELRNLLAHDPDERPLGGYLDLLLERLSDLLLDRPSRRLATYGSLRPGEANHHLVAELEGRWLEGTTRGLLAAAGWAAERGYPGLVWDPEGPEVPVQVLESPALPAHWERLDAFEGPSYLRILVPVATAEGARVCNLYAVRTAVAPEPEGG